MPSTLQRFSPLKFFISLISALALFSAAQAQAPSPTPIAGGLSNLRTTAITSRTIQSNRTKK